MTIRDRRNINKLSKLSPKVIIVLCVIALAFWGWQAYKSLHEHDDATVEKTEYEAPTANNTESDNTPATKTDTAGKDKKKDNKTKSKKKQNYEKVKLPADVKSEILNYPGFTVSFNSEYHQPNYVVWELTGDESRSSAVSRTNNFAPDPNVEGCPTLADYLNSGFDRGHMAPAADMKWDNDAMNSCFLLTNMSPQHHALNSGAWNTLEDKCRQWAQRDSAIVIVCGPILTDEITRYIGDTRIAVPERYFKVILAPYANPPRAIGFIMPNSRVPGGLQASAVSIDEVEDVTGFDFFSALPDNIENKIEAECNYAKWTRK